MRDFLLKATKRKKVCSAAPPHLHHSPLLQQPENLSLAPLTSQIDLERIFRGWLHSKKKERTLLVKKARKTKGGVNGSPSPRRRWPPGGDSRDGGGRAGSPTLSAPLKLQP